MEPTEIIVPGRGTYIDVLLRHAAEQRIPVQGELELTTACNFKCAHCYVSGMLNTEHREMNTDVACRIVDEVADAGCIWLLITGGEPLVHRGFRRVWKHAIGRGLRLSLFTNGSMLSDDVLAFLQDYPPEALEVSVYSLRRATFDAVTGTTGQHSKLMDLIPKLQQKAFGVVLKTPLLVLNYSEIPDIEEMASQYGFGFRMDAVIHPTVSGNRAPVEHRIPAESAADLAMRQAVIRDQLRCAYHDAVLPFDDKTGSLPCSAGIYSFQIAADLTVNSCSIFRKSFGYLGSEPFRNAWQRLCAFRSQPRGASAEECKECPLVPICVNCPGIAHLHGEEADFVDGYVCEYTKAIAQRAGLVPSNSGPNNGTQATRYPRA